MKLIKLDDGRIIEITQKQFDQLNNDGVVDIESNHHVDDNEVMKSKILKHLKRDGKISYGAMKNRFRSKKVCLENAINALLHDKVIFITHEEVKHRFGTVEYLNLA